MTPFLILVVIALIFAICSMIWPAHPLLAVSVILLSVAMLVSNGVPKL